MTATILAMCISGAACCIVGDRISTREFGSASLLRQVVVTALIALPFAAALMQIWYAMGGEVL